MIQRVETQRNVTSNITASKEIAANVIKFSTNSFGDSETAANAATNALVTRNGPKDRRDFEKNKNSSSRFCDHYQRSRHTTEQCFKTIGYPDWYQGLKEGNKT